MNFIKYRISGKEITMKRPAMALVLAILMGASYAYGSGFSGTFAEAKALADRENKPLLVDFFAEW